MNLEIGTLIVSEEFANLRLDKYLALQFPFQSRTYFQYLIEHSLVLVNGSIAKKRHPIKIGDEIEIEFALTPEISLEPEQIPLDILYEDEDLLAINKQAGLVVHPGAGNWSGTFVNGLLYHCRNLTFNHSLRPGIVHRLDKETTGVLLAAKNEFTQQALVALFASRQIFKEYIAICLGNPGSQKIEKKIARDLQNRKKMAVSNDIGKEAVTLCNFIKGNSQLSLVQLIPLTGRTHQIRVHLQSIGCPILGDPVYGILPTNKKYNIHRQLLHAKQLSFKHPRTGQLLEVSAPLPEDFNAILKQI